MGSACGMNGGRRGMHIPIGGTEGKCPVGRPRCRQGISIPQFPFTAH
jgi:hypothetical protein